MTTLNLLSLDFEGWQLVPFDFTVLVGNKKDNSDDFFLIFEQLYSFDMIKLTWRVELMSILCEAQGFAICIYWFLDFNIPKFDSMLILCSFLKTRISNDHFLLISLSWFSLWVFLPSLENIISKIVQTCLPIVEMFISLFSLIFKDSL